MASFLRRQDNLETLKTRNLYLQNDDGTYPADQSVLTISGTQGHVVTSDSITVQNLQTCELIAADGLFKVDCATGNTDISGNLRVYGSIFQGVTSTGTILIDEDSINNPNIQITAKAGGDGQAYFDLVTERLDTATNIHFVRSIMGNDGTYTVFHQTGAPGATTTLQQMVWNSSGTAMEFRPGAGANITYIQSIGTKSPSFVTSDTGSNGSVNVPSGITTTLSTFSGTDFPQDTPVTRRYNVVFTGGATVYPTYADISCVWSGSTLYKNLSPSNGLLPAGWSWSTNPTLGTTADIQIYTTDGPYTATLNYVTFGAQ